MNALSAVSVSWVTYILQKVFQIQVFGNLLHLHTVLNRDLHEGKNTEKNDCLQLFFFPAHSSSHMPFILSNNCHWGQGCLRTVMHPKGSDSLMSRTSRQPSINELLRHPKMTSRQKAKSLSPRCSVAGCRTSEQAWPAGSWPPPVYPGDYPCPGWLWKCKWNR